MERALSEESFMHADKRDRHESTLPWMPWVHPAMKYIRPPRGRTIHYRKSKNCVYSECKRVRHEMFESVECILADLTLKTSVAKRMLKNRLQNKKQLHKEISSNETQIMLLYCPPPGSTLGLKTPGEMGGKSGNPSMTPTWDSSGSKFQSLTSVRIIDRTLRVPNKTTTSFLNQS